MKKIRVQNDLDISKISTPQSAFIRNEESVTEPPSRSYSNFTIFKKQFPKHNHIQLKDIIKKHKTIMLRDLFIKKMKRTIPASKLPENLVGFQNQSTDFFDKIASKLSNTDGLKVNSSIMIVITLINIFLMLLISFLQSFILAFGDQIHENTVFQLIFLFSIGLFLIDTGLNFTMQRYENGKILKNILQISQHYLKNDFFLDLLFLVDLFAFMKVFQAVSYPESIPYLLGFFFVTCVKLVRSVKKSARFQHLYLLHADKERYYALLKILLGNLIIGHVLSIIFNLMPHLNTEENWILKNGFSNIPWYQKYLWGYYWGTNIMLTVGFGDLNATNSSQALILIFVETFSCITFAYNFSVIGNIMADIKDKQQAREKNLKIFLSMSEENNIPQRLSDEIMSFIDESFQIKQQFLYSEYDTLINKLPANIKSEYQKSANKHLFLKLPILNMLTHKTFSNLAQKIIRKIAHPQEIVYKRGDRHEFAILQKGQLALACRNCSEDLNGRVIQKIILREKKPKLITIDFLRPTRYSFDVKSVDYSKLYFLPIEEFYEALREHQLDYQFICELRDRDIDDLTGYFESQECPNCRKQKHTLFNCPKLHYIPFKQLVIAKSQIAKIHKMPRTKLRRHKTKKNALTTYLAWNSSSSETQVIKKKSQDGIKLYDKIFTQKLNYESLTEILTSKNLIEGSNHLEISSTVNGAQNDLINKIFEVIKISEEYKGFWAVEADKAADFPNYFMRFNPGQLHKKFQQ